MGAGTWLNNDGLNLNYGTQKALPEIAGDYLMYGSQRELEIYLNLCPDTMTYGNNTLPGLLQYSTLVFGASTTTAAAAGIISETVLFPLQTTANTLTGTVGGISTPQLFLESIEVRTLIPMTASSATGINLGLVTAQTQTSGPAQFVRVSDATTSNGGQQLLANMTNAMFTYAGQTLFMYPNSNGAEYVPVSGGAGAGLWLVDGNVPQTTTTTTSVSTSPLATNAFLSAGAIGGTYTGGLLKIRIKYSWYGTINQ